MNYFTNILQKYKYLVITRHEDCKMYTSLRDIARDIGVDFTTISKKLKVSPDLCICKAKTTKESYCIKRL
jgi:hypothetical protein